MAGAFTIEIEGLKSLMSRIDKKAQALKAEVEAEIKVAADEMVGFAIADAPADQGGLRQSISNYKSGELQYDIVAQKDYAPFVEFGTRARVSVPEELSAYAAQFQGGHESSLNAKQAIFDWCKRKGVDQKAWYPIYISLMVNGVTPHPFFFKNYPRMKQNLLKNIKNIINLEGL